MNNNNITNNLAFANSLIQKVPKCIESIEIDEGKLTVFVSFNHLVFLVKFLRNHTLTQYKMLVDVTVIDYIHQENKKRFVVVYQFLSMRFNHRIFLKLETNNLDVIPSISHLFKSSIWSEREIWDLFGLYFANHPDLRRILTDYGFQGFPLRKDFPLTGYIELYYNDEHKKVVYMSLELAQEYRIFDFLSPWKQQN